MNKIFSMSVWGSNPRYTVGVKKQIELCKKYLPDWTIRLYVDNLLYYQEEGIDIVEVKDNTNGVFWRFLPMFENPENIVLSRDTDSRLTFREIKCIEEWITSDKILHTFKDHESHYEFPIMAGGFGYKGMFDSKLLDLMNIYMRQSPMYLIDQIYLRDHVWPIVHNNCLIHSMREPGWFSETRKKLINKYSFCGNGYDAEDMPLYPDSLENIQNFNPLNVPKTYKFDFGLLNN